MQKTRVFVFIIISILIASLSLAYAQNNKEQDIENKISPYVIEKLQTQEKIKVDIPMPYEDLPQRPATWISHSSDLKNWCDHTLLIRSSHKSDEKTGPGAPPIRTDKGWLLIYHHVEKDDKGRIIYTVKAVLLDLKNPSKIIAKIPYPILEPKERYEVSGDVNNVVFPTGVVVKNDELFVYYGTADKYCGLATIKLDEIIDELLIYSNI